MLPDDLSRTDQAATADKAKGSTAVQSDRPSRLMSIKGSQVVVDRDAIQKAFGSEDENFVDGLLVQLIDAASKGKSIDEKGAAFVASIVRGVEPRDQVEAMLAAQMAAVHNATMTFGRRLA